MTDNEAEELIERTLNDVKTQCEYVSDFLEMLTFDLKSTKHNSNSLNEWSIVYRRAGVIIDRIERIRNSVIYLVFNVDLKRD